MERTVVRIAENQFGIAPEYAKPLIKKYMHKQIMHVFLGDCFIRDKNVWINIQNNYGNLGYLEKSGFLLSRKAFLPSFASSDK